MVRRGLFRSPVRASLARVPWSVGSEQPDRGIERCIRASALGGHDDARCKILTRCAFDVEQPCGRDAQIGVS